MTLSERIRIILEARGCNQKEFAEMIDVSTAYVSKLLRGESGMSSRTAQVVENQTGFSKEWILNEIGPKEVVKRHLSSLQTKLLAEIESLTEAEARAVYAYIEVQKKLKEDQEVKGGRE